MTIRPQNRHLKPIQPGEVRNPAGRPKGSRNKLNETFLQALAEDSGLRLPVRVQGGWRGQPLVLPTGRLFGFEVSMIELTTPMSACGTKRSCQLIRRMSAIGGKADVTRTSRDVCL